MTMQNTMNRSRTAPAPQASFRLFPEAARALTAMLALLVLVSGIYPLAVWGISVAAFHHQADGSLIRGKSAGGGTGNTQGTGNAQVMGNSQGTVIGSELLGQAFVSGKYFHPRPSAAGNGYDPTSSGGSNLGQTSRKLIDSVKARVAAYRAENGLSAETAVPGDAVTASGSGLDPEISLDNALLQIARVAKARGWEQDKVEALVRANLRGRDLGFLGEPGVNVLKLNLALDAASDGVGAARDAAK